ncbi:hypothetical protein B0A48_11282 [Cryoendolithus antarcticus]|uniref:Fork-head domain-containing protein n=1 Tax=Cryoendolithus antarcticus TaxID=1507870 RepID=A0A1V8SVH4_9PEZI|nr:hypothetical protein B0A48_11282 [Cryoendolithus antarcticus]
MKRPQEDTSSVDACLFAAAPIAAPTPKSWTGKLNLTRKKLQQTPDRTPTLARQHGKIVQAGSVEIAHDTYLVPMEAASKSPVRKKGTAVKTVDAPADSTYVSPAAANSCSKVPDSAMEYGTRHPDSVDTKSARPAMAKRGGFKGVLGKRAAKISTAVPRLSAPPSRVGGAVSLNTSISQGTLSSGADNPDEMPDLDKPEQRLDAVDVPTKTQRGKPLPLRSHVVSSADLLPATEDPTSAEVPRSKPTLPSMNNDSTIPASVSATQAPAWTEEELARIKDQLGDSHKRPRRTARFPLVGMALASATRHRLQSIGVNKWVADNIPTYKLGEGDWENSLTALLSTGQSRGPNLGYWRQHEWTVGSGGIGTGCWWELLPGKIDEMWQWDAQRKQPIQPRRALSSGPTGISTRKELLQHTVRNRKRKISSQAASSLGSSCADTPLAERLSTPRESVSTRETPSGDQTSSEEEPIMMKRRKLTPSASTTTLSSKTTPILVPPETKTPMLVIKPERPPRANMIGTKAANGERPAVVPDSATVRWSTRPVDIKPRPLSVSMQDVKKKPVLAPNAEEIGLATYIAQKAPQLDFSARSLFSEWPEYHPSYVSNSTTSSIRLTRKQLFRKPACYSRLEPFDLPAKAESPVKRATVSPEKRPRAIVDAQPDDPYPWEEEGTDDGGERREVESFEQLLGLSEDPVMKILCEGDLAFREEVRMESGRLARGQGVYMTGYGA